MESAAKSKPVPAPYDPIAVITRRKKHFLRKRKIAERMRNANLIPQAEQLEHCGEYTTIMACSHCGHTSRVVCRCKLRVCPLCSYKEAKQRGEYLKAMTRHMQHPKLLTLTMPLWMDDARDGITFIRDAFNRLRKSEVFQKVVGGSYQIEIKIKDNGFHIHIHALLDCPYMPYQHLWSTWKKIIGHDCPQTDIRSADTPQAREYAAKYAAKASDFDADLDNVVAWYEATKGLRLFATFGKWFNATMEELDPEHPRFIPKCTCAQCGAEGTMYLARDGPFLFSPDVWKAMEKIIVPHGKLYFPITEVQAVLNA
jgi:hypothetical protein